MRRLVVASCAALLVLAPVVLLAQSRPGGSSGSTVGSAAPRGDSGGSSSSSSSSSSSAASRSSGSSGGTTMGSSGGSGYYGGTSPAGGISTRSYAGPRSGDVGGTASARTSSPSVGQPVPVSERPRGDGPLYGRAAPRGSVPGGNPVVVVDNSGYWWNNPYYNGTYGSWYYSPYGPYYGAYGNLWGYSPYLYGASMFGWGLYAFPEATYGPGYYNPSPAYTGSPLGSIRLHVKPKDAEVYVDGTFYGKVDNYDGRFDHLDLPAGAHLLEIRAEGYQTIQVSLRVLPSTTITYSGEMKAIVK